MPAYHHPEAFCLMKYATADRSVVEVIWNSRDGVTPFGVMTPDGTREMFHINFTAERRAPDHTPKLGDRIFVDLTMERAIEKRRRFVERFWNYRHPSYPTMAEQYAERTQEEVTRELAHADMRQGIDAMSAQELMEYGSGPPDLVVVDHERLRAIVAARPLWAPRRFA